MLALAYWGSGLAEAANRFGLPGQRGGVASFESAPPTKGSGSENAVWKAEWNRNGHALPMIREPGDRTQTSRIGKKWLPARNQ